ncbi:unnamed protein product [Closterium sp. NIES-53]
MPSQAVHPIPSPSPPCSSPSAQLFPTLSLSESFLLGSPPGRSTCESSRAHTPLLFVPSPFPSYPSPPPGRSTLKEEREYTCPDAPLACLPCVSALLLFLLTSSAFSLHFPPSSLPGNSTFKEEREFTCPDTPLRPLSPSLPLPPPSPFASYPFPPPGRSTFKEEREFTCPDAPRLLALPSPTTLCAATPTKYLLHHIPPPGTAGSGGSWRDMLPCGQVAPPSVVKLPRGEMLVGKLPPSVVKLPPSVVKLPPSVVKLPPSVVKLPPSVVKLPPSVVKLPPSVVKLPPSVVKLPPSVVKLPPSVVKLPGGEMLVGKHAALWTPPNLPTATTGAVEGSSRGAGRSARGVFAVAEESVYIVAPVSLAAQCYKQRLCQGQQPQKGSRAVSPCGVVWWCAVLCGSVFVKGSSRRRAAGRSARGVFAVAEESVYIVAPVSFAAQKKICYIFNVLGLISLLGDPKVAARPSISSSTTSSGDATEGNNGAAPKTAHSIASLPDEEKEEHAYYLLMSAVHPQLSLTLAQANTTKDMWGCIMARFDCMGNHAQVALLRDLITTRMDPTMSLRCYFDRVGNLTHQLKSAGFELPSWVVVISIILNLPDSFKTLTETICTVKDIKSMTVEYLQSRLLDADWERSQSGTSRNMEGAYNLHSQPSHPIRSGSRQSPTCRYCKKIGHTIDECFKLKKKKELEESSRWEKSVIQPSVHVSTSSSADIPSISTTSTAPSAPQSVPDSRYVDIVFSTSHRPILPTWTPLVAAVFIFTILLLLLLFPYGAPYASALTASSSNMIRTSSWLVDSGASSHICSDRSLFSSLQQPTDDIIVRFGGGETYKVLGVGTVVSTLRSQTSETTIQLDNVLFLPSSVHNLLSVRALGAAGIAVSFPTAGRVELKTDAAHIGEGFTRNNLFYLQLHHGSSAAPPINPTACPVSTTTSSYLWHRPASPATPDEPFLFALPNAMQIDQLVSEGLFEEALSLCEGLEDGEGEEEEGAREGEEERSGHPRRRMDLVRLR